MPKLKHPQAALVDELMASLTTSLATLSLDAPAPVGSDGPVPVAPHSTRASKAPGGHSTKVAAPRAEPQSVKKHKPVHAIPNTVAWADVVRAAGGQSTIQPGSARPHPAKKPAQRPNSTEPNGVTNPALLERTAQIISAVTLLHDKLCAIRLSESPPIEAYAAIPPTDQHRLLATLLTTTTPPTSRYLKQALHTFLNRSGPATFLALQEAADRTALEHAVLAAYKAENPAQK